MTTCHVTTPRPPASFRVRSRIDIDPPAFFRVRLRIDFNPPAFCRMRPGAFSSWRPLRMRPSQLEQLAERLIVDMVVGVRTSLQETRPRSPKKRNKFHHAYECFSRRRVLRGSTASKAVHTRETFSAGAKEFKELRGNRVLS
jgi:hypothetical protein